MRLSLLLLVALSWSALVAAQETGPDYDYYELGVEDAAPVVADAPAADLEEAPLSQDEPVEAVPVTEATTEKTTTTEATPKGRRKLISIVNPRDRRRRPNVAELRAKAAAAAAAAPTITTEKPSTGAQTSQTTGRRGRRPSRRGQTQTQTEATTEAADPIRTRGRSSARSRLQSSSSSSPSSPQTSSGRFSSRSRSSPTTEAPSATTAASHRFSPRRRFRPQSATKVEEQEETPTQATQAAPSRFGRRRQS